MKVFRTLFALLQALLPLALCCFFAIISYDQLSAPYHIIVAIAVIGVGIYLAKSVFYMITKRGILDTITGATASPELDNLTPMAGSGVDHVTAIKFEERFKNHEVDFLIGTVAIWGDWNGRQLNQKHEIDTIEFSEEKNLLTINFKDHSLLKIKKPGMILYSNSYLKIKNAKEVLWQITNKNGFNEQYSYLNTGADIKTQSNTSWTPHSNDTGFGIEAVYLQG